MGQHTDIARRAHAWVADVLHTDPCHLVLPVTTRTAASNGE